MKSQRSLLMQRHLRSGLDDFCRTIMAKKTARKCSVRFELLFGYLNCSSFDLLVFVVVVDCAELASSVISKTILDIRLFCLKKSTKSTSAGTHTAAHNLSCVVTLHKTVARAVLAFDWLK